MLKTARGRRTIGALTTERRLAAAVVLAALCGSLLWSSHRMRSTTSVTFDETFYLNGGLQTVHDGRLDTLDLVVKRRDRNRQVACLLRGSVPSSGVRAPSPRHPSC